MGGKEVVVAVSSPVLPPVSRVQEPARKVRRKEPQGRVPEWWPEVETELVELGQEAERWAILANRLVRAIIDNRVAGRDYRYDDAVQVSLRTFNIMLRQLCKISGVKVSFDAENARDSFYRATTGFVLDDCSRTAEDMGTTQINGENPRDFLAGLSVNIGLDKFRAATLICASVAARTRACLLQCWALEIQGKRTEALDELVKICRIHRVFPPEENSAEMEMVAGGLKKNLEVAERVHLLSLYRGVCTTGVKTAAEALGLEENNSTGTTSQEEGHTHTHHRPHQTSRACRTNENMSSKRVHYFCSSSLALSCLGNGWRLQAVEIFTIEAFGILGFLKLQNMRGLEITASLLLGAFLRRVGHGLDGQVLLFMGLIV
ncbi:unnamed protein product [Triticum turgidum subsp. durum]|uniref:Uncharacterized protein n=1 Tax=Triticum turgidum subsp. durum TaxID=4567 RepID=A0A9R0Q335_TRITD|nr:unnamed protein product [Triticum turgidum subsp. durum]